MTAMSYGSFSFTPVPMISLERTMVRSESENAEFYINVAATLNGVLFASSGAQNAPSGFKQLWELREDLESAFLTNRKSFQINSDDGDILLSTFPDIKSISFEGGDPRDGNNTWIRLLNYSIVLEYQEEAPDNIKAYDESFSYQEQDNDVIAVTHTVNVTGLNTNFGAGSGTALDNARDFALTQIGNNINPIFIDILAGLGKRNVVKSEDINPTAGTYALTEQYILASGDFREEFIISIEHDIDGQQVTGSIDGSIIGYGDTAAERFINASGAFPAISGLAFSRVQSVTDVTLNPTATQFSTSYNQFVGTVNYTFSYNDDPTPTTSGAIDETINISFTNPGQVFASIPIPGRASGPILQDIGTVTSSQKTLAANLTFEKSFLGPFVFDITPFVPSGVTFFKNADSESFDYASRKYNRSVTWTFNGTDTLGFTVPSGFLG